MLTHERLAECRKIMNCVPFVEAGAGCEETMKAMHDLIHAHDKLFVRATEAEATIDVLAEEVRQSRVQIVRAEHPDGGTVADFYELNTAAKQSDDCNYAAARAQTDAHLGARAALAREVRDFTASEYSQMGGDR